MADLGEGKVCWFFNKGFSEMKSLPGLTLSWTRMETPALTLRRFLLGSFPAMRRLPLMR